MMNWSKDYNYCRKCHSTRYKHILEGYCHNCFKQLEREREVDFKMRKCLMCERPFNSTGPGHRRCDLCSRKKNFNPDRYRINIT